MTKVPMIHTADGIVFIINSKPYDCSSTHSNYDAVVQAAKDERWDEIPDLINIRSALEKFVESTDGTLEVHEDYISYNGQRVHGTIIDRIFLMREQGFDIDPMVKFLSNMFLNPHNQAVEELYDFLVSAKLPITEDGHFLAYKRVNSDYTSCHDGKTDNSIGSQPTMAREEVDPDRFATCSVGLHFCSFDYLKHFNNGFGRTVILKINPKDVVAIPSDYDHTKGRAWTYHVEGEVDLTDDTGGNNRNVLGEAPAVVNTSNEVPTSEKFENSQRDVATPTVLGYDAGFRTKRYKTDEPGNPFDSGSTESVEWNEAWSLGHSDATKRNPRKYKTPKK